MGPYRVFISPLSLCITRIDNKHLIYVSILAPVVLRKVHSGIMRSINRLSHHLCRMLIVIFNFAILILDRLTIVSHIILQGIGTIHVEVNRQLIIALRFEVVTHRAGHSSIIIAFRIEEVIESLLWILRYE